MNIDIKFQLPGSYRELRKHFFVQLDPGTAKQKGILQKPFMDLWLTAMIDLSEIWDGTEGRKVVCPIPWEILPAYAVSEDTVFSDALINSPRINPPVVGSHESFISSWFGMQFDEESGLFMATTEDVTHGASVLAYPGFLDFISEGADLLIIPSSTNEFLFIRTPEAGILDISELNDLIKETNSRFVQRGQVLSDHAYWYDAEKKELHACL